MKRFLELPFIILLGIPGMVIGYLGTWFLGGMRAGWLLHKNWHAPSTAEKINVDA